MSQDRDPDGSDDCNEWISPSVQMSNGMKDHQEEGRKRMKEQRESDDHESKSQRFHVFPPTPPPLSSSLLLPSIRRSWTRNPSIITCLWKRRVISILIIVVCTIRNGFVLSFPQGAPAEVCITLEPRHFETKAASSSSDYYLTASSSKFGVNFGFSKSGGVKGVLPLSYPLSISFYSCTTSLFEMMKHLKCTTFKMMISQEAEEVEMKKAHHELRLV